MTENNTPSKNTMNPPTESASPLFRADFPVTDADDDQVCTQLLTGGADGDDIAGMPGIDGAPGFLLEEEVTVDTAAQYRAFIDSGTVRARLQAQVIPLLDALPPDYAELREHARHLIAVAAAELRMREVEADRLRTRLSDVGLSE